MTIRGAPDYSYLGIPPLTDRVEPKAETNKASIGYHMKAEYWDIAIEPIRSGWLAVSLHRFIGLHGDTRQDSNYICEVRHDALIKFVEDALVTDRIHTAELASNRMEMQVSWKKDYGRQLFVGSCQGRRRAMGHSGPIEDSVLLDMLSALRES